MQNISDYSNIQGSPTGFAAPVQNKNSNGQDSYIYDAKNNMHNLSISNDNSENVSMLDKDGKIHFFDKTGKEITDDRTKMQKIKDKITAYKSNIGSYDKAQYNDNIQHEKTIQSLGIAAMPLGVNIPLTKEAVNVLKPYLGRRLSGAIVQNAGAGLVGGLVEGIGKGIVNGENPIRTGIEDAAEGALLGAGLGAVGGKFAQNIKINELNKLIEKRKNWGIAYKKAAGNPELAIQTLLEHKQGFVPGAIYKEGIGDIDFVWGQTGKYGYGLAHIIEKRNNEGLNGIAFVEKIPEIIRNGKIVRTNNVFDEYGNVVKSNTKFIKLKYKNYNTVIKLVWNNARRKWVVTSFKDI